MTVKANSKRHQDFASGLLFQMEQWMALPLGVACLAVFLWAAFDGREAFSLRHLSHFSTTMLASIGWFLTFAVGLFGVALMKFAFYKQSEPEPDAKRPSERVRMASADSTETSNRFTPNVSDKRRR